MKYITMILGIVLFVSCINKEQRVHPFSAEQIASLKLDSTTILHINKDSIITIDLNPFLQEQSFDIMPLVSDIKVIPLETTDKSLIDAIYKIIVSNAYVYIMDRFKGGGIIIFDHKGNFVKRISSGQGPGELSRLYDIDYSEEDSTLIAYQHSSFLFFSAGGEFIRSEKLPFGFYNFLVTPNGYLFKTTDRYDNPHLDKYTDYTFLVTDKAFQIKSVGIPKQPLGKVLSGYNYLYKNNHDIKITHYYTDTIFQYQPLSNTLKAVYALDYKDKKLPDSYLDGQAWEKFEKATRDNNYYFNIGEYLETDSQNVFYLRNDYIKLQTIVYRNKQTGHLLGGTNINIDLNQMPPIGFPKTTVGNYFVSLHYSNEKDSLLSNSTILSEKNKSLIRNMKEEDNPALIFFQLKDF